MDHDETYEDTREEKENDRLRFLKNDVLSTGFCYSKYSKRMEEVT